MEGKSVPLKSLPKAHAGEPDGPQPVARVSGQLTRVLSCPAGPVQAQLKGAALTGLAGIHTNYKGEKTATCVIVPELS